MLTKEIMGLLCLAILWVNTLLLVGAAWGPLRDLLGRLRRMRTMRRGEVMSDGELAVHEVAQIGRKLAAKEAILFHDSAYRSESFGGTVKTDDGELEIVAHGDEQVEVWIDDDTRREAAACSGADVYQAALGPSKRAKGYLRTVRCPVGRGDEVWISEADGDAALMIANFDPRGWARARVALIALYQIGVLVASAGITYLALYPPLFGTISTIGGVAGLLYFLLVQPVGVMVKEHTLPQHQAFLRGTWRQPAAAAQPELQQSSA